MTDGPEDLTPPPQYVEIDVDRVIWDRTYRDALRRVLAVEADGAKIETVEALASQGHLHPLQQCFLEGAALQCGVCTPGFLVTAKALLDKNPNPSEHEIRFNLANNLCRCTGYDKIVRAVQAAAKHLAAK